MSYFWVALGGAIGSVGRFWISELIAKRWGSPLPWHTIGVNVTGSFVIGLAAVLASAEKPWAHHTRALMAQFVMVGICGGYTTFSSFSLQTLSLMQRGEWPHALINVFLSVALCLFAVWLGWFAGQWFTRG